MRYAGLDSGKAKEVEALFYNVFSDSEGEKEAESVSGLVKRYLKNYPRKNLRGYVAIDSGEIVGSVFFSELTYPKSNSLVFLLSPMAVKTAFQGRGIGRSLINFAHEDLKQDQVNLTLTYGDINFYSKVGYQHISESKIAAPFKLTYPDGWLVNRLDGITPLELDGPSICIPELQDESLW